jgi:para-nitrobenzyl esterase
MGVIATTTYGRIEGIDDGDVLRFRGIPFAQPPAGELRFRAPQPPEPWSGVRDATTYGPTSPQNPSPIEQMFGQPPEPWDEDCLYLNVITPALDDARRPVLVWIHGGGFLMGSGSSPLYDGASFARRGDAVFVSLNYRLGELGFLYLDELDGGEAGSGNNGIRDQIAALQWVRDNIAAFGGDPDNVTIFGESAGGMSVGTLLASPAARGLFHKAIAQSGAARNVVAPKLAAEITDDICRRLGAGSVADLRQVPVERLLEVRGALVLESMADLDRVLAGEGPLLGLPFQPIGDDLVVPADATAAVASGAAAGIPLLVGTTRDEWKLFALMDFGDLTAEHLAERGSAIVGDGEAFVAAYAEAFPGLDPKALFGELANDYAFRIPAIRLAEAQRRHTDQVYSYLFDWKSTAFGGALGACHAIEVPFVFHVVDRPELALFLGEGAPVELSDQVQDAWLAFARTGDPSHPSLPAWPAYDAERRATMELATPCRVVDDPLAATRRLWDTII